MSAWDRLKRAGRRLGRRRAHEPLLLPPHEPEPLPEDESPPSAPDASPPFAAEDSAPFPADENAAPEAGAPRGDPVTRRGLSGWVEDRAKRVVQHAYERHASDLEERAQRVVSSVYERTADDLEERAVRAMRRALESEAERIKDAIEHGIAVKKREVRLSLLVLVISSLVYLALYWFTSRPDAP